MCFDLRLKVTYYCNRHCTLYISFPFVFFVCFVTRKSIRLVSFSVSVHIIIVFFIFHLYYVWLLIN